MTAVIATQIAKSIKEDFPEEISETFMYSDNSAVLGWIRDKADRWKPFIANRIREIHEHSKPECWSYVKSAENPADLLSRCSPLDTPALQRFWLFSRDWLARRKHPLETQSSAEDLPEEALAERKVEVTTAIAALKNSDRQTLLFVGKTSENRCLHQEIH